MQSGRLQSLLALRRTHKATPVRDADACVYTRRTYKTITLTSAVLHDCKKNCATAVVCYMTLLIVGERYTVCSHTVRNMHKIKHASTLSFRLCYCMQPITLRWYAQ
jgi:hypothetical protein